MDENLTPHEVRLLRLLSEGHSYQTIGDRLGISIRPKLHPYRLQETPRPLQIRSRKQGPRKENHSLGALWPNLPFLIDDTTMQLGA